jgi:hypothetical protein
MELAGLEPATSWVRSSRPLTPKAPLLQRFMAERLECRNISRNSLHRVLQRHGILDKSAGAIERSAGEHLPKEEGVALVEVYINPLKQRVQADPATEGMPAVDSGDRF